MKVSIVTPSFNQAQFLEETILSVLDQSYQNIEYIIIDGGSTDGSIDIIKKYAHKLKYWVSEKDKGQSHAINKGLEHCTGEILAYLNSDDLLELDAVEKIVKAFLQYPQNAIIYGKCTNIREDGVPIGISQGGSINYFKLLTGTMLPYIHQPACFFKRTFINRNPIFDNKLKYGMDYELILWILKKQNCLFIDSDIARFRYHSFSKTVSQTDDMYLEKMAIQRRYSYWLLPLWIWRYLRFIFRSKS